MRLPTAARAPLGRAPLRLERQDVASPARRGVLFNALVAATALLGRPPLPALAAYTIVPTGTVVEKEARLVEVKKQFEKTPDDPYAFGEKAQLEYDLNMIRKNRDYASQLSREVVSGNQRFLQGVTLNVPDMLEAVSFWTGGMGALVLDTRLVNGVNVTRVGFGSQSLNKEDGAKFALELVEAPGTTAMVENGVIEYIQLAMPIFRMSQVMRFGGEIISAYGWTELVAPGGIPLRVSIDESRRDPFEFVALRTTSMDKATAHLEALGLSVISVKGSKKINKKASLLTSNSLFENEDATQPDREIGSTLMTFGDPALCTGCLLLPPTKKKKLVAPSSVQKLRVVGSAPAGVATTSPDGLPSVFLSAGDFEASVSKA